VAGQNFGRRRPERVADTLKQGLGLELMLMAAVVAACQLWAPVPVAWFTSDPQATQAAITIVHVVSWNFFVNSGFGSLAAAPVVSIGFTHYV